MQPWHLLVYALTSWVNRKQQLAIGYLKTEKGIFRDKLGKKRMLLNDNEFRRRLYNWRSLLRKSPFNKNISV
ncbi:hypothetical protein Pla110_41830 [Polystyrenella longa]|uniref:Uncharacterized protein n=1 Tax=Polystyrenella longa TaxID=2528007 RepID=A0A518CT65_9PLAN|nr:hypothetical protein [Polystyrenella longa]QDU82427.1 hypothetical protein Pla110_41830 [Polystyrenella longa]